MFVYSPKIIEFIQEIKGVIKRILTDEIRVKVTKERFNDERQDYTYPIKVVIYNHRSLLGYFDPDFYELGFHENLMYVPRPQLHNVVRHELAHYMLFIKYGAGVPAHGTEFKTFCQQKGWGEEVSQARLCLDEENSPASLQDDSLLRKVQKLMSLATSSNPHEAEQAMLKSQQLLVKHNLEAKYLNGAVEEKLCLKRILKQKKDDAKMRAISQILTTFLVNIVYTRSQEHIYLEVLGTPVNVEIAEYVANHLQEKLERMWQQIKQYRPDLKGLVPKNSFFHGIATGYLQKIDALRRAYPTAMSQDLMVIEKQLEEAKEIVYPRLKKQKSQGQYCEESLGLGVRLGRQLTINPALNRASSTSEAFLPHFK